MAKTFKRLKVDENRYNGTQLRVGLRGRRAMGPDTRPVLNQPGMYLFILQNGTKANINVRLTPGQPPKAVVPFHGQEILVPLLDVARSIKIDDRGQPARVGGAR